MQWPADLDHIARTELATAYVRRVRMGARIQAIEIGRLLAGGGGAGRVSSDQLFGHMGVASGG